MIYQVSNNDFVKQKIGGWTLYTNKSFPSKKIQALIPAGDLNGVRGPFERVIASRFARVYKCSASFKGLRNDFYFKQFLYRSPLDFIKHLFRPGRAIRSLKASIVLDKCGLLSPEVIAVGQRKIGPVVLKSFLITRSIENSLSLTELVLNTKVCLKEKRQFLSELGSVIGRMHSAGVFHGDLRAGNILIKKTNDKYRFYFLDNERTRQFKRLPNKLRVKNLVQINMFRIFELSITDRMRFYKSYLNENKDAIDSPKSLAKEVARKTDERLKSKPL